MKNWQRKILFFSLCLIFLIFGPILVFYSLGYRFDFEKRKVTKTGGVFIKAIPKEVEVSIDGKIKKRTDSFFGSLLIDNLLPKKYKVRVTKEGYFPWEKELEVEEEKVTEVKNLILFPENLNFYQILSDIDQFWILPNGKELILKEKNEEQWVLKSYSLEKKIKSYLLSEEDFKKETEFLGLNFNENSEQIEIQLKIEEEIKNFLLNLKKIPPQIREKEEEIIPENVICFKKIEESEYFFENSGYLLKNGRRLNNEPFSLIGDCRLRIFNDWVFLETQGALYFLKDAQFEKIFENLKGIEPSPGSKKLAIFSDYEIWLFENGKNDFLNRFSEKIDKVYWFNEDYLILIFQNKIKLLETDKRDKINVYELKELPGEDLSFSFQTKKIYFKKDGKLFETDPLLR